MVWTSKEQRAQKAFFSTLEVKERTTKQPVIVAIVGLVGSGRSFVAKKLAKHISATVIEGDKIRIELRKQNVSYEKAQIIAENTIIEVIKRGGNVVVDSDNVTEEKRITLQDITELMGATLFYIRTCMDPDVMFGRIVTALCRDLPDDFFGGASSKWDPEEFLEADEQSKGAAVKFREMWRRTPLHYDWINKGGGTWTLKKLPFVNFEIDTTYTKKWKEDVIRIASMLSELY
ncbi:AAA family ATPase [Candidatus Parcubacteria bacterium]|nr:AAA family ATPase [Candidatus Parcubacteria bacterium]